MTQPPRGTAGPLLSTKNRRRSSRSFDRRQSLSRIPLSLSPFYPFFNRALREWGCVHLNCVFELCRCSRRRHRHHSVRRQRARPEQRDRPENVLADRPNHLDDRPNYLLPDSLFFSFVLVAYRSFIPFLHISTMPRTNYERTLDYHYSGHNEEEYGVYRGVSFTTDREVCLAPFIWTQISNVQSKRGAHPTLSYISTALAHHFEVDISEAPGLVQSVEMTPTELINAHR